jgi:hypothetical protein|tara:strand:+ start:172 stop:342 length:171 start_codon:yes stop_codon:yes gene_type:complete
MKIELKKDWKRKGLKTVPSGTIINIDQELFEKLDKKGLFTEKEKVKKSDNKININI